MTHSSRVTIRAIVTVLFCVLILYSSACFALPVTFIDDAGKTHTIAGRPRRVVSLVPSITEIICEIGGGDTIRGRTYYDIYPSETAAKTVVGGFFSPSIQMIETCDPEVIFIADLHERIKTYFAAEHPGCAVITLSISSLSDLYETVALLGRVFDRKRTAARLVNDIKGEIDVVSRKVAKIPDVRRKRVMRLMGRNSVMTPGDDSFQNELIRLAGGIPHSLEKKGPVVPVTEEEWRSFNPQVIYGCGGDRLTALSILDRPGWRDVEAVKNGSIHYFPCDLTCRMAARTGAFVAALSSLMYQEEFSDPKNRVIEDGVRSSRPLAIDLDYVADARIDYSVIHDFVNKTLVVEFQEPLSIISTLDGPRTDIKTVGNHYSPPPCWGIEHALGLDEARRRVFAAVGIDDETASFLFTGADMDNLVMEEASYKDMTVYVLVTAGVMGNAMKAGFDVGNFYEPGTINVIVMTNRTLSPRAMTRAIICATEAKTAALSDMDIRSSYTPRVHQATGTGTDNVMVVSGSGCVVDNAGGHTKMGELIARAVYGAVGKAVYRQNGIVAERSVFTRLRERKIDVHALNLIDAVKRDINPWHLCDALEKVLLEKRYAEFVLQAMAVSDAFEAGLAGDGNYFMTKCREIAGEIAGESVGEINDLIDPEMKIPVVLKKVLNALLNGLHKREMMRKRAK